MSACRCDEGTRAPHYRGWVVTAYKCHHSAFGGYRERPSDYSEVRCNECGAVWRTKAGYVEVLERAPAVQRPVVL